MRAYHAGLGDVSPEELRSFMAAMTENMEHLTNDVKHLTEDSKQIKHTAALISNKMGTTTEVAVSTPRRCSEWSHFEHV